MITIVQGEKKTFFIRLVDRDGEPYDLTGFDQFKVSMGAAAVQVTETVNANGSVAALSGAAGRGKLSVTLGSVDTTALRAGERQEIDIELNNAATPNPKRVRFVDVLTVVESTVA